MAWMEKQSGDRSGFEDTAELQVTLFATGDSITTNKREADSSMV